GHTSRWSPPRPRSGLASAPTLQARPRTWPVPTRSVRPDSKPETAAAWRRQDFLWEPGSYLLHRALSRWRLSGHLQNCPGQRDPVIVFAHDGGGAVHTYAGLAQRLGGGRIRGIDHQQIEEVVVAISYASNRNCETLRRHESSGRPAHCVCAYDWAHSHGAGAAFAHGFANSGHGENRPDAGYRITGREQHESRRANRFDHSRRWRRIGGAGEANRFHGILIPALDEI